MMIQQITSGNTGSPPSSNQAKLADAAQQFEGMLLQEMLKPMRSDKEDGGWSGEDNDSDSGEDTINSFGIEAVAKAIAQGGGLGIARQVIQQVTAEQDKTHSKATKAAGTLDRKA